MQAVLLSIWLLCVACSAFFPRVLKGEQETQETQETTEKAVDDASEKADGDADDAAAEEEAENTADSDKSDDKSRAAHEFWLSRSYEPGVVNRLLAEYLGTFSLSDVAKLRLEGATSYLEQTGVSLVGLEGVYLLPSLQSEVTVGVQQERWPDWDVTENRLVAYWKFAPFPCLFLSLGLGYRSPQFNVQSIWQSLAWPSDDAEIGVLYSVQWNFLELPGWRIGALVGDYERMRLYSDDNIHIGLRGEYDLTPHWSFLGYASVGATGVSGGIVTFSQTLLSIGIRYAD